MPSPPLVNTCGYPKEKLTWGSYAPAVKSQSRDDLKTPRKSIRDEGERSAWPIGSATKCRLIRREFPPGRVHERAQG